MLILPPSDNPYSLRLFPETLQAKLNKTQNFKPFNLPLLRTKIQTEPPQKNDNFKAFSYPQLSQTRMTNLKRSEFLYQLRDFQER